MLLCLSKAQRKPLNRIGSLLGAPHLVHGLARMSDHMDLVEVNCSLWQVVGDAFDEGR
jgi:hypothetical protein